MADRAKSRKRKKSSEDQVEDLGLIVGQQVTANPFKDRIHYRATVLSVEKGAFKLRFEDGVCCKVTKKYIKTITDQLSKDSVHDDSEQPTHTVQPTLTEQPTHTEQPTPTVQPTLTVCDDAEVYLLHRNKRVFKAKVMPFAAGQERIVHCKLLKEDEDRYIILKAYKSNMSENFFDEDSHSAGSFIKWDKKQTQVPNRNFKLFDNDLPIFVGELEVDDAHPAKRSECTVRIVSCFLNNAMKQGYDPNQNHIGRVVTWRRENMRPIATKARKDSQAQTVSNPVSAEPTPVSAEPTPVSAEPTPEPPENVTLFNCYTKERQLIGVVRCHSDRTVFNGTPLTDNETIIEVISLTPGIADASYPDGFAKGRLLRWSKVCLEKIQRKGSGKQKMGRGIKRVRNEQQWQRSVNKKNREMGLEYVSMGKTKVKKVMPAKEFIMYTCAESCRKDCKQVTETERKELFDNFWQSSKSEKERILLADSKILPKEKSSSNKPSRRTNTIHYTLKNKKVCQKVFLTTFGITANRINRLLKNQFRSVGSGNYIRKATTLTPEVIRTIHVVIEALPKYNIHYADTSKEADNVVYLSPTTTVESIFELVMEKLDQQLIVKKPKSATFHNYFAQTFPHVKVKAMSTDKCNVCDDLTKSEEERQVHDLLQKDAMRQHKIDQTLPYTHTFDMQSTMPLPKVENNLAFYKRQLWLYNEGVHNHVTNKATMFLWLEHEAGKGGHEICSVLYQHILLPETKEIIKKHGKLIYWCDSTVAQNRNTIVAWFIKWAVDNVPGLKSLAVKFFVTGHSYNAGDRDFGLIKKKLAKVETIFSVEQYCKLIEKARKKPSPFAVVRLKSSDIVDFTSATLGDGVGFVKVSKIKGRAENSEQLEKVQWFHIRSIEANEELLGYKISYGFGSDDKVITVNFDDMGMKTRGKPGEKGYPKRLYGNGRKITKGKFEDIMDLLKFVPPIYHEFFKNLPH